MAGAEKHFFSIDRHLLGTLQSSLSSTPTPTTLYKIEEGGFKSCVKRWCKKCRLGFKKCSPKKKRDGLAHFCKPALFFFWAKFTHTKPLLFFLTSQQKLWAGGFPKGQTQSPFSFGQRLSQRLQPKGNPK